MAQFVPWFQDPHLQRLLVGVEVGAQPSNPRCTGIPRRGVSVKVILATSNGYITEGNIGFVLWIRLGLIVAP